MRMGGLNEAWTNDLVCNPNPDTNFPLTLSLTLNLIPSPSTHIPPSLSLQIFGLFVPQQHLPMPEPLEYRLVDMFWILTNGVWESFLILRLLGSTMTNRGEHRQLPQRCFSSSPWAVSSKCEGFLPYGSIIFSLNSQKSVPVAPSPPTPLVHDTPTHHLNPMFNPTIVTTSACAM